MNSQEVSDPNQLRIRTLLEESAQRADANMRGDHHVGDLMERIQASIARSAESNVMTKRN